MPVFPSREWCDEALRLANADPETRIAAEGWTFDIGAVVDAEPGKLAAPFTLYLRPKQGRFEKVQFLKDPDDLDEIEPSYRIRAPYSVWKGLIQGNVDPVEAVLKRRIAVEGDLQPLIERMKHKGLAYRMMAQLETAFVDEKGK